MQDLKESIEWLESLELEEIDFGDITFRRVLRINQEQFEALKALLKIAQLFLEVKGFPEKKICDCDRNNFYDIWGCTCGAVHFNEALDLCALAHVKLMQENMLTVEEIKKILQSVVRAENQNEYYLNLQAQTIRQAAQQKASLKEGNK